MRIPRALWSTAEILALPLRRVGSQGKVLRKGVTQSVSCFGTHQADMLESSVIHTDNAKSGHGYQTMATLSRSTRMDASHKAKATEKLRRVQIQDTV